MIQTKENCVIVSTYISMELKDKLRDISAKNKISMSKIIQNCIICKIEEEKPKWEN